jgi:hypothetical protein
MDDMNEPPMSRSLSKVRLVALALGLTLLGATLAWQWFFGFRLSSRAGLIADWSVTALPLASMGLAVFAVGRRPFLVALLATLFCAILVGLDGNLTTELFEKYHGRSYERLAILVSIIMPVVAVATGVVTLVASSLIWRKVRK